MNRIYVVGIGPGKYEGMSLEAKDVLDKSDTIIGYTVYTELVRPFFPEKEYLSTPMTKERDRCVMAFLEADKGKTVSMVCSGDAGVYGMAGLMIEVGCDYPDTEVLIIPGVSALSSGAAVLGAPLIHDFAVISLSDRLTPKELIKKRLRAAAMSDFAIVLYNPSSKGRPDYLKWACEILLEEKAADTVCGYVKKIGRDGQESHIMTLSELMESEVDMFTTVFIGNSQTKVIDGKMVTPRGY